MSGLGADQAVLLSWKKDVDAIRRGEIVTYHVYRSVSELGPFTRVNYYGILPGSVRTVGDTEANKDVQIKRASSHSEDLLEELALDDTPELREIKSEI